MKAPLRSASLLPKAMPQGSGHAAAHGVVTPKISLVMSPFLTTGQVSAMVTTDGCSVTRSFLSLQRVWLVRPSLGLYCDSVSVTYYWICKFSCRWLNYFKRTLVPNPPFFRWPDSNTISVTPMQFTFLSQLWFALLDCSQHQVSNSCCRHAVQTTPYPLHCDNVQVLSACVVCTVHNSTHRQPQGYTELCPRWPLLSYTVER